MKKTPYLSVVATARNDNHGGDLLARIQTFVNALATQAERHRVATELVLVEWNPPADRPSLQESLDWPANDWWTARIVEVPAEVHARFEHADRLPLFQMIAKNVGISRARGEYILATNVDIILSDELFEQIRPGRLHADRFYRVDRHDADIRPDPSLSVDDTLAACRSHVIRVCGRIGTRDLQTGTFYRIYDDQRLPLTLRRVMRVARAFRRRLRILGYLLAKSMVVYLRALRIDLIFFGRWIAAIAFGVAKLLARRSLPKRPFLRRLFPTLRALLAPPRSAQAAHAEEQPQLDDLWRKLREFDIRASFRQLRTMWLNEGARIPLHTNACGDFTLLSRSGWDRADAYPELEMFSMHIDGLFLYQAYWAGLREVVLSAPAYHIEHTHGFKPDPKEIDTLNSRLARAAIPQITNEQFLSWIGEMFTTRQPLPFNRGSWGLADEALEETVATPVLQEAGR